jgi:hypothetical protein
MYAWLLPRIGGRAAIVVMSLWYGALLVLVLLLAAEPSGNFRYDDF